MDRVLALVMCLLALPAQAATTVYPFQHFNNTAVVPYGGGTSLVVHPGLHNWSAQQGAFKQSASAFSLNNPFGYDDAQKISKAITGTAPVAQAAAKKVAAFALGAGGFMLAAWALEGGLEYIAGEWKKTTLPAGAPSNLLTGAACGGGPSVQACFYTHCMRVWCGEPGNTQAFNACYGIGGNYSYVANLGGTSCVLFSNPWAPTQAPATPQDFENYANNARNLTDAELNEMLAAGLAVPINPPVTKIGDFTGLTAGELADLTAMGFFQPTPTSGAAPTGDPYVDPVTGEKKQPYLQLDPAPNGGVQVTPYEQVLNPDGTPKLDQNNNPINVKADNPDPCVLNPSRAGCSTLGDILEDIPAPDTRTITLTPENPWGGSGQCPQDVVFTIMGHAVPFKFTGACQFFTLMNPVVQAAAWAAAIFLLVTGARRDS